MKLSIIIPVYNEDRTIMQILDKVVSVELDNVEKEIIIIDDYSSDNSKNRIEFFKTKRSNISIKKIFHKVNLGKGAAIKTGLKYVTGDFVIIQDADLEYDPIYYKKLLTPILSNLADVVYGTRLKNYPLKIWGNRKTVLPTHLVANKLLTLLTNIIYGSNLTDMETCYKLFKKEAILNINIVSNRFDIEPEITAKLLKKGLKIVEIKITTVPRSYREGKKISWKDGFIAIWTLIKYRFTN